MGQQARQTVQIRTFPGLATGLDPLDAPPGAAVVQENVQSSNQGSLRTRPGAEPVTFEEE